MLTLPRQAPTRILGTGTAFAGAPLSNEEVVRRLSREGRRGPRSDSEILELAQALGDSLGIERRFWTHPVGTEHREGEANTVDLSAAALRSALERAELGAAELAAVICTTSTPKRITGANAPAVADQLGVRCAAWDVRSGCPGGLWALVHAHLFAAACGGPVAVVGADAFSVLAPADNALAGLALGDGAGAVIVTAASDGEGGLLGAALNSDGSLSQLAGAPAPFPPTAERIERRLYELQGDPDRLQELAPELYREVVDATLKVAGLSIEDIELLVPHQTSRPAIESLAAALDFGMDRTVCTVSEHANVGTAGILIALDRALRSGAPRRGQLALLAALGGGLTWGAAAIRL